MKLISSFASPALVLAFVISTAVAPPAWASDRQERALETAALAHAYGERCPDWKVNWHRYVKLVEAVGLDVDKLEKEPTFGRMVAAAERAEHRVKPLDAPQICRLAESEFGPKGSVEANLMSNSLAVRGMNKVFDWFNRD